MRTACVVLAQGFADAPPVSRNKTSPRQRATRLAQGEAASPGLHKSTDTSRASGRQRLAQARPRALSCSNRPTRARASGLARLVVGTHHFLLNIA